MSFPASPVLRAVEECEGSKKAMTMLGMTKARLQTAYVLGAIGALSLLPMAQATALPEAVQTGTVSVAATNTNPALLKPHRKVHQPQKSGSDAKMNQPPVVPEPVSVIHLQGGKLTIDANHADLAQILNKVAAAGGVAVEGIPASQPIFGTYGPGTPNAVLTELLTGSGENFMMVGGQSGGFPTKLILSKRGTETPQPAQTARAGTSAPSSNPATASGTGPNGQETAQGAAAGSDGPNGANGADGDGEPLGPGAIAHVPPNEAQQGSDDSGASAQQNLQRLEKIQAQQQQQQTAPQ